MSKYLTDKQLEDIINNLTDVKLKKVIVTLVTLKWKVNILIMRLTEIEADKDAEIPYYDEGGKYFYGKNRYKWSNTPPASSRTRAENIIMTLPGLKESAVRTKPATPYEA